MFFYYFLLECLGIYALNKMTNVYGEILEILCILWKEFTFSGRVP